MQQRLTILISYLTQASERAKSKDEVREQDTDSISSNSTVSEELTMRETALLSEEAEPEDTELAEPQDSELAEPEESEQAKFIVFSLLCSD